MDLCVACGVFLFDWMHRPLPSTDYFASHVRQHYLEKAIPDLLPEIRRLLSQMNEMLRYIFTSKIRSVRQLGLSRRGGNWLCMNDPRYEEMQKELLELEWCTTVHLFREHVSREDVDFLLTLIDERYILDSATTSELWLGMILHTMIKEMPPIHAGHTEATVSSAAVAMNGLVCPIEHAIAHEVFDSAEDTLYA